MKKFGIFLLAGTLAMAFASCGQMKTQKDIQHQEITKMDSIAGEMDSTSRDIEEKTQEIEQAVDDLLKDLE